MDHLDLPFLGGDIERGGPSLHHTVNIPLHSDEGPNRVTQPHGRRDTELRGNAVLIHQINFRRFRRRGVSRRGGEGPSGGFLGGDGGGFFLGAPFFFFLYFFSIGLCFRLPREKEDLD